MRVLLPGLLCLRDLRCCHDGALSCVMFCVYIVGRMPALGTYKRCGLAALPATRADPGDPGPAALPAPRGPRAPGAGGGAAGGSAGSAAGASRGACQSAVTSCVQPSSVSETGECDFAELTCSDRCGRESVPTRNGGQTLW